MAYPIPDCSVEGCRFREVPGQGVCVEHGGVREEPPRCGPAPLDHMRLCGARRRDGGLCRQPPIRGAATCRLHGGSAPQVRRRAAERVVEARAIELARQYGVPREISPLEALTEELARTQGHVDWLAAQLDHRNDPQWLGVYQAERAHLARLAQAMAPLLEKAEQQRAVLSERTIDQLDLTFTGILGELGHDPGSDAVRAVVARHLRRVLDPTATLPDARGGEPVILDGEVRDDQRGPEPVAF
jgi:hypothetical protein